MNAPQSLIVTGSIELQLDRLAEKVATRVAELITRTMVPEINSGDLRNSCSGDQLAGTTSYDRPGVPEPRHAADSAPFGEPLGGPPGRTHPHLPTTSEELP